MEADLFNDDRIGRSLCALFDADRHSLMTAVSCNAIGVHGLLTDEIHNDSTSITLIGNYKNQDPAAVKLKHGYNKDFRPDCKQIVFGLNIITDGIFPLITNTKIEACEVLKKYKTQPFLEKRMYIKKTVLQVAPVFLKKAKRIEAILLLYFVSLIARNIRMNMANGNIEKLPILPQRMNTKKPTWNNIRYFFRNVHYSEILRDGVCIQSVVKGLTDLHNQINWLINVPESVYKNLQPNWWQFKYA